MALTKENIVESLCNQRGFSKKKSAILVESLLELMKSTLEDGEDVLISGFGKFSVREKNERKGRNPQTGEMIILPPKRIVTFKCSSVLKRRINGVGLGFGYSE